MILPSYYHFVTDLKAVIYLADVYDVVGNVN